MGRLNTLYADQSRPNFLAIVGASGSGKSSLVRAGLLPKLRADQFNIYLTTPTADPLGQLVQMLSQTVEAEIDFQAMKAQMRDDERTLYSCLTEHRPQKKHLIVIDQFEELFTLCDHAAERQAFVQNLLHGVTSPQSSELHLLITLRADFYHRVAALGSLRELLEDQQKYIGPMTRADLRAVIEGPAQATGVLFQPGLVDLMLDETGDEPGHLPLLSHALLETWKRRSLGPNGAQEQVMTLAGYSDAGGVRGAIARTADAVMGELSVAEQKIARNTFTRLTELGEGSEDTRRRATFAELTPHLERSEDVIRVLARLASARLITTDREQVEVAHEALIREWRPLRGWLDADRAGLRILDQLSSAARFWEEHGRRPADLYVGTRLDNAVEWQKETEYHLSSLETEFLKVSRITAEQEMAEREMQRERELQQQKALAQEQLKRAEEAEIAAARLRRRRNLALGLATLGLVLASVAFLFFRQANQNAQAAEQNAAIAEQNAAQAEENAALANRNARTTQVQNIAMLANSQISRDFAPDRNAYDRSLLMLRQAINVSQRGEAGLSQPILYDELLERVSRFQAEYRTMSLDTAGLSSVVFTPDGERVIVSSNNRMFHFWDLNDQTHSVRILPDLTYEFWDWEDPMFTFSPDRTKAAFLSSATNGNVDQSTLYLWELDGEWPSATNVTILDDAYWGSRSLSFSSDGSQLLSVDQRGHALDSWDLNGEISSGSMSSLLFNYQTQGASDDEDIKHVDIAVSPGGKFVAGVSEAYEIYVWPLEPGPEEIPQLGFSQGEPYIFPLDAEDVTYIEENPVDPIFTEEGDVSILEQIDWNIERLYVAPNGNYVVLNYGWNQIKIWDISDRSRTPRSKVLNGGGTGRGYVRFDQNGEWLLTDEDDRILRWDLTHLFETEPDVIPMQELTDMALSPDGSEVVAVNYRGEVHRWNLEINPYAPSSGFLVGEIGRTAVPFSLGPLGTETGSVALGIYRDDGQFRMINSRVELYDFNGNIQSIVELNDGQIVQYPDQNEAVAFSTDGRHLAVSNSERFYDVATNAQGEILLFDLSQSSSEPVATLLSGHFGIVRQLRFSHDGTRLASVGLDGALRLWNLDHLSEQIKEIDATTLLRHNGTLIDVQFPQNDERLIALSDVGDLYIWDVNGSEPLQISEASYPPIPPNEWSGDWYVAHAISSDGSTLAVAESQQSLIRLYDLTANEVDQEPTVLRGHEANISALAFSPDGNSLASGDDSGALYIWDLNSNNQPIVVENHHQGVIVGIEYSADQEYIVSVNGGFSGAEIGVKIWSTLSGWGEKICQDVGRNLTWAEWQTFLSAWPYEPTCPNLPVHCSVPLEAWPADAIEDQTLCAETDAQANEGNVDPESIPLPPEPAEQFDERGYPISPTATPIPSPTPSPEPPPETFDERGYPIPASTSGP